MMLQQRSLVSLAESPRDSTNGMKERSFRTHALPSLVNRSRVIDSMSPLTLLCLEVLEGLVLRADSVLQVSDGSSVIRSSSLLCSLTGLDLGATGGLAWIPDRPLDPDPATLGVRGPVVSVFRLLTDLSGLWTVLGSFPSIRTGRRVRGKVAALLQMSLGLIAEQLSSIERASSSDVASACLRESSRQMSLNSRSPARFDLEASDSLWTALDRILSFSLLYAHDTVRFSES